MPRKTKIIVLIITILVLLGVGIGVKVHMNNKNSNLEKQRSAAIGFKEVQSGVEEIKFMQDGSYSGAGNWSVSVDVIVNGKKYKEILNQDGLDGGDPLPEGNTGTKAMVKIYYSNGKKELLK